MTARFSLSLILLLLGAGCRPAGDPVSDYRPEEAGTLDHALCLLGFTMVRLTETASGHHLVAARINGRPGHFVLDTGVNATVVDEAQAQYFGLPSGSAGPGQGLGVGGQVVTRQVRIADFQLGKVPIRQHRIAIADLGAVASALAARSGRTVHGIVGQDVMKEHRGVIDVAGERLHLIGPDQDPRPVESGQCGSSGGSSP